MTPFSRATVTGSSSYGLSFFLYVGDTRLLWFGEFGGRIILHPQGTPLPAKYHLRWDFTDGTSMTFNMQMWGFVNLMERSEIPAHPYAEVGIPPLSGKFTFERFNQLLEEYPREQEGYQGFSGHQNYQRYWQFTCRISCLEPKSILPARYQPFPLLSAGSSTPAFRARWAKRSGWVGAMTSATCMTSRAATTARVPRWVNLPGCGMAIQNRILGGHTTSATCQRLSKIPPVMRAMLLEQREPLKLAVVPHSTRRGQVLVKVRACRVCRTDLHVLMATSRTQTSPHPGTPDCWDSSRLVRADHA
jgi:hypothetical protein